MRKKSIIQLVTLVIVAIAGIVFAFVPFAIPNSAQDYKSFANSIKYGIDLKGGAVAVYEAKRLDDDTKAAKKEDIEDTIKKINKLLSDRSYENALVTSQGEDKIRIEVPNAKDPGDIFTMMGKPVEIIISTKNTYNAAKEYENSIRGQDISKVFAAVQTDATTGEYTWGVSLEFKGDAKTAFANLTQEAVDITAAGVEEGKIYMYINGEENSGGGGLSIDKPITDGKTFIAMSGASQEDAEDYALQLLSGTYNVKLNLVPGSNMVIDATLGKNSLRNALIAGGIIFALVFIFMVVFYRGLGAIACLTLVFYIVLLLFFLAVAPALIIAPTLPTIMVSLSGLVAIFLSVFMTLGCNILTFTRIKEEYALGKKIKLSFRDGFKKSIWQIADVHAITGILSLVMYITGSASLKSFAGVMFAGTLVSLFTSLALIRWLLGICSRIEDKNEKAYALKRRLKHVKE